MDINFVAVLIATVVQFIIGAIWYMPVFGSLWGKIHGFDEKDPATQAQMRKQMAPLLVTQLLITFVTSAVFALIVSIIILNPYYLAVLLWLGFIVPTQVAVVIFGGTVPRWIVPKILIMAGGSLLCVLSLALIIVKIG